MEDATRSISKKKKPQEFNTIARSTNLGFTIFIGLVALLCILPFVFVIMISLTDEQTLLLEGYQFFPSKFSGYAYQYILKSGDSILRSYGVTIFVTVTGTLIGLFLTSTYAYAISRSSFAFKRFFTIFITIPMLFSGGMVASYLVVTKVLMLKETIWALILPLALSPFNIIILRTFFKTTIPESTIESGKLDGASEFVLFFRLVLPMAVPGLATIGLFLTLSYWNDWFQAMLYMDSKKWIPIQYLMIQIERSMDWLVNNKDLIGVSAIEAGQTLPTETVKMAIVVISTLPILFAYPFFQRYFVGGLTIGAVKE